MSSCYDGFVAECEVNRSGLCSPTSGFTRPSYAYLRFTAWQNWRTSARRVTAALETCFFVLPITASSSLSSPAAAALWWYVCDITRASTQSGPCLHQCSEIQHIAVSQRATFDGILYRSVCQTSCYWTDSRILITKFRPIFINAQLLPFWTMGGSGLYLDAGTYYKNGANRCEGKFCKILCKCNIVQLRSFHFKNSNYFGRFLEASPVFLMNVPRVHIFVDA